jgi:cupin-like protein
MNSSPTEVLPQVREWHAPTRQQFGDEIVPAGQPAVLRGVANDWALVAAARQSEAEADLYMGPTHPTPAGTPVSMVHVTAPEFDRYPRFASALETAQEAELSPGDAIFIPRDWFYHVEALERFNILVNYWWDSRSEAQ